jgi:pyridoxal phosphate enzyme (YggS family)
VTLVAVTKQVSPGLARALVGLGAADLGENYPQALWAKAEALADLPMRWHLIGHLQGNKAKKTFPMVRMIHAVDSLKLLRALDDLARGAADPPEVCLQVNTSGEPVKHGWAPGAVLDDAEAIAGCQAVPVVGLMTMAALGTNAETARPSFVALRESRDALRARTGLALEHLSMGMSNDFETAVEEGSTLVRVGSALFEGVVP